MPAVDRWWEDPSPPPPDPPAFPYGPADRATGPGGYQPQRDYSSGPYRTRSYYNRPRPPAPPPDPWAGISASAHSAATSLTDKFLATMGWPSGWDGNGAALAMAKAGINLSSPYDAYEWLFQNKMDQGQRDANPWSEFGMIKDDYNATVGKLNSVMNDWTGDNFGKDTLKSAIRESWTPDQIRNFAMYGNAAGTGPLLASAQLTGDMPWLSVGESYSQTLKQFEQFEQHTPADKQTLASFFRFGASAKQLRGGQEAIQQAARPLSTAEVR